MARSFDVVAACFTSSTVVARFGNRSRGLIRPPKTTCDMVAEVSAAAEARTFTPSRIRCV